MGSSQFQVAGLAAAAALFAASSAMAQTAGAPAPAQQGVEIVRNPGTGLVAWMSGAESAPVASAAAPGGATSFEASARVFLGQQSSAFGLRSGSSELVTQSTKLDEDGRGFVRFQQTYQGLPIVGAEIVVQMDAGRNVMSVNSRSVGDLNFSTTPGVSSPDAVKIALDATARAYKEKADNLKAKTPVLSVHDARVMGGPAASPALVWRVDVTAKTRDDIEQIILVDAQTGRIAVQFNQIMHAAPPKDATQRVCDSANSLSKVPCAAGDAVANPKKSSVPDVKLAFKYAETTYDFYALRFGRNSLDDKGLTLTSTVRYQNRPGQDFANAFWSSELQQMVYGKDYATALDVVGHELSHGFTNFTSNLFYYYQSGSINESLSDIFGELIQRQGGGEDGWLLGEDLPIGAIRNLKNPPQFNQPDKMTSSLWTGDFSFVDQGGVHTNSGVGNKAAYLMTAGGTFNGKTVKALGIDKTVAIFYRVNAFLLTSSSDYADLGNAIQQACKDLIGKQPKDLKGKPAGVVNDSDCKQAANAVAATEMSKQPQFWPIPAEAATCPSNASPKNVSFEKFEAPNPSNWVYQPNGPNWFISDTYAASNAHSVYMSASGAADDFIFSTTIAVPNKAYLRFAHFYNLFFQQAGGVVEYSVTGGNWKRVSPGMYLDNPYNETIDGGAGTALAGDKAFSGFSGGWTSSRINLKSLAGKNVKFRFRVVTNFNGTGDSWAIDDIRVYTCK
jgi:bacillolysin